MPSSPTPSSVPAPVSIEDRLLLFSASEAQAAQLTAVLPSIAAPCLAFTDLEPLLEALEEGAGALLVDEDAITERAACLLASTMAQREPWSNLPIIILTSGDPAAIRRLDRLDLFGPATSSNVSILERPVHEVTLRTVVHSALRARRRQYEVRDLMQHLQETNEKLRENQEALQAAKKTLQKRVTDRTEQVRTLALSLTTAKQRERARVSELLHDHLQQLLHGAKMWAERLTKDLDAAPLEAPDRILSLLNDALETTRTLAAELDPPVLQEKALPAALDWLSTHVQETHDFHLQVDVSDDVQVSEPDLRTLLFRSVHELVFNVIKHAEVDTAIVRARQTNGNCMIDVVDEGAGFDSDPMTDTEDSKTHFGLVSVRERLNLVGGELTIESAPAEGTHARIVVPLGE